MNIDTDQAAEDGLTPSQLARRVLDAKPVEVRVRRFNLRRLRDRAYHQEMIADGWAAISIKPAGILRRSSRIIYTRPRAAR